MANEKTASKYIFGLVFIVIGVLWLLSNLGYLQISVPEYLFSWQSILIIIGLVMIINNDHKFPGIILILIGSYFLLPEIYPNFSHHRMWELFFPFLLILFGLSLLFKRGSKKKTKQTPESDINYNSNSFVYDSSDKADFFTIFSESNKKYTSQQFTGGNFSVALGKTVMDLTDCKLAQQKILLDTTVFMGELILIIPRSWQLENSVQTILGELKDHRKIDINSIDKEKTVFLKGTVILGSLKITYE